MEMDLNRYRPRYRPRYHHRYRGEGVSQTKTAASVLILPHS